VFLLFVHCLLAFNNDHMNRTICKVFTALVFAGLIAMMVPFALQAQGTVIKNGTTMKVTSGTTVVETVKMTMESGGAVDNSGTIILKGNLENQNATATDLGAGTFQFSGSNKQYIIGQNIMNNVTLNNAKGLILNGSTQVNGTLTLTSGIITLGSNNLTLGTAATVAGSLSASNMVVATGSGELRKLFTDGTGVARNFTFPVGDSTNTAHYSPVTLNFTTGTFSGAYAAVNLTPTYYPGFNNSPYLNRYWTLSQTGISSFSCDAQFNYVIGDVTGTEANMYCLRVTSPVETFAIANTSSHYLTATGITSFSSFSGGATSLQAGLSAYLEGPYNSGTGQMNTLLNTNNLIPLVQPYGTAPYNTAPFNYSGTESISSVPADAVDWILVELRQASAPGNATSSTVLGRKAALLYKDGSIHDVDGTTNLVFKGVLPVTTNIYPVILHRNHLPIISANAVTKTAGSYVYDFSSASTQIYDGGYGTGTGCKQLGSKWGLIAGNSYISATNNIINNFDIQDGTVGWVPNFSMTNYNPSDFNMDGIVNNTDISFFWVPNFTLISTLP
jgi:hypothetical protein